MSKIAIEMQDVSFSYGQKNILDGFNLSIEAGKTYCLVGSSGSGKTTALRLINGLLVPDSGRIVIDGRLFDSSQGEKWRRSMGYSIQGSGLFPHMTLEENLSIIARKEGWNSLKIKQRIKELCLLMNLPADSNFLLKRPREISGGQQQRVGIARALFMRPSIMLMDEPFSALDPITRMELQTEFIDLQRELEITIVLVTHDLPEAFSMAHEIVLLNKGSIEQKGRPSEFLTSAKSEFVRSFISSHSPGNVLKGVYLYSVLNSNIYACCEIVDGFSILQLSNGEAQNFTDIESAKRFLTNKGQASIYWVDKDGAFLRAEDFSGNALYDSIDASEHILSGIKTVMQLGGRSLAVVNRENKFVGVFDREALSAL